MRSRPERKRRAAAVASVSVASVGLVVTALALAAVGAGTAVADPGTPGTVVGHVYEVTNAAAGNAVQVFDRAPDGRLTAAATVATGGHGTGASLASQSGIARSGHLLVVVNAGDNTVSTLAITPGGLVPRDVAPSGGLRPVSLTVHDGTVYVLNHDSDTISGLHLSRSGQLSPLPRSTRALTPNPAGLSDAAQVAFTPGGEALLVTQRATNTIDTFAVHDAYPGAAVGYPSAGRVPYGFDFDRHGDAIVSEAASSSASSYRIRRSGVQVISAAVPDTQAAACWLVVTRDGRFGYAINAASASISSYRIAPKGQLTLSAAVAASTGAGPTDAALSPDSRTLHVRLRDGSIASYLASGDGSLTTLGTTASPVPAIGSSGLATD